MPYKTGELQTVEFKKSLRWDTDKGLQVGDEAIKKAFLSMEPRWNDCIKKYCCILNNQAGGTLFIGVGDDKSMAGLERDYESLVKKVNYEWTRNKNRDLFELHLDIK